MAEVIDGGTGEDGGEVVYVGGKAVEQNTTGETPDGDHGDELAAAKAAVKKVMDDDAKAEAKEAGKAAAKEAKESRAKDPLVPRDRDADGKFIPNDSDEKRSAKPTEPDPEASALRKALSERKETAKYKAEANAELERMRAEVRQVHQQVLRDKQEVATERAKLAQLRSDPIRAIRENGWDPEQFIMDIAQDGTPEGKAARANRELQQSIKELHEWKAAQAEERQQQARQLQQNKQKEFRQQVERQFLDTTFNTKNEAGEEQHPHLAGLYKGHEVGLLAEADVVAEQYRNMTGKEATFSEIAEYLEERAAKWYKSMSGRTQAVPPVTQGKPTQGSSGKKSLSPAGSSERRSLGKSFADLDGEERREAAMTAVRSAIHASGERT